MTRLVISTGNENVRALTATAHSAAMSALTTRRTLATTVASSSTGGSGDPPPPGSPPSRAPPAALVYQPSARKRDADAWRNLKVSL